MTETKPTNGLLTDRRNNTRICPVNSRRDKNQQWLMTNFTRVFQPMPSWLNWPITSVNGPNHRLTNTIRLTLKMTSALVVETPVTNNSSFQNYLHPDDYNKRTTNTPGFKPFTILCKLLWLIDHMWLLFSLICKPGLFCFFCFFFSG